jgi:hypothetical protein
MEAGNVSFAVADVTRGLSDDVSRSEYILALTAAVLAVACVLLWRESRKLKKYFEHQRTRYENGNKQLSITVCTLVFIVPQRPTILRGRLRELESATGFSFTAKTS